MRRHWAGTSVATRLSPFVSDRDTRFTSAFWTGLHEALGATLIFGSPHHHNTTSKVERVNGVIANVLRAVASDRCDDWPEFLQLVEFAINDSASPLGSGYTPFYADRGQHPRRPLTPPDAPDPAAPAGSGKATAHLMARVTAEVRALLQERQDLRKAELDAHRRDIQFAAGDEVLLDTEHTPLPSRSLLSSRWMGPFKVLACTAPNTYRLDIHAVWRVFPEFNVERLRPYLRRPDHMGGDSRPPPPVLGADGGQEYEVKELLRLNMRYGRPYVLVRWAGRDASGDTWEPLDNLTNCAEAIAAFVDGELRMKAHLRAGHHLSLCGQCAGEVEAQGQARAALRDSRPVSMPSTLMNLLSAIPQSTPDEAQPAPPSLTDQLADDTPRSRRKRR
jgi:hypothetical protein